MLTAIARETTSNNATFTQQVSCSQILLISAAQQKETLHHSNDTAYLTKILVQTHRQTIDHLHSNFNLIDRVAN